MKHHFIKKIKIAAMPITRLVSPLSILVDYVVKEILYYRLQFIHLIDDCTLRLVKDFCNFSSTLSPFVILDSFWFQYTIRYKFE